MPSSTPPPNPPALLFFLVLLVGTWGAACSPQSSGDDDSRADNDNVKTASAEPASAEPAPAGSPLRGTIASKPFEVEGATLQDGILTVRQGDEFFADLKVTVFLFLDSGELPEGRSWQISADDADFSHPHVHVSVKDESANVPGTEIFMDGYDLELRFGKAEDLTIPGELSLRIDDPPGVDIQGSFVAELEGLVLRDGVADRRVDGIPTLKWLADRWLEKTVGDGVEIVDHHGTMFHHPSPDGRPQIGWTEVEYRSATDGQIEESRLRFVKGDDGWAADERFDATSLRPAHPLEEPDADEPFLYFPYVAARQLEEKHAGQSLYDAEFQTSYGAEEGEVEVSYKVGSRDAEKVKVSLRFVREADGTWRLANP